MKIKEKIIRTIKDPQWFLLCLDQKRIIRIPDKIFLKIMYKRIMKNKLNLKKPTTFNEKLQWLKLYDKNSQYTKMVDKYDVKQYVAKIIGEEYIIPTIGIYDRFDDIDFDTLPDQFVMKCTHDSGSTIICKDKNKFNIKQAKEKIENALKQNFFYLAREWPYKNVKPRIIIEKYIEEEEHDGLTDYKFMCFDGKVKCSFVCLNRNGADGLNVDFYDINWNKMPFKRHYKNSNIILEKPKNYTKMIELAEKLSKEIPFVRVDFYEINNIMYFGELTFYPGGGFEEFTPKEYDEKLGNWIKLPK